MKQYTDLLFEIKGKTIALVYIFEGEDAPGFNHYEIWQSDVLSSWLQAVMELSGMPLVLDTRTFIQKAMDRTLPKLDYIINLNNGAIDVSNLGLVPSVASFLSVPCIPCNTLANVVGEHKLVSNLIAYAKGMNIPQELDRRTTGGIIRPVSSGSSCGVVRLEEHNAAAHSQEHIYQEFISGFDVTTPVLYNPLEGKLEVLPGVMYYPDSLSVDWFLGESAKKTHSGYTKKVVKLSQDAQQNYLDLARAFTVNTFCRIDARVKCASLEEAEEICTNEIPADKLYFLEINPTPTVKANINFHTALEGLDQSYPLYTCLETYNRYIDQPSLTGFILSCSMIALL